MMRRLLVATAFVAPLALVVVAAPVAAQHRVDERRAFAPSGPLRIMMYEGSVRVRTWDRDSIRVRGTLDDAARRGFYLGASAAQGGKMGIEPNSPGRAELEVFVPAGTMLWVKTTTAPIHVTGVVGPVDLYTVMGSIRVDGSPRSLHAESMAGSVEVSGAPRLARLKSGSGAITFAGGGADVALSSVSGNVTVTGDGPMHRLHVETVGGAVRVARPITEGSAVTINSHDGAVEVRVPSASGAEFILATLQGNVINELTRGGVRKSAGLKGHELAFTNGRGGAEVTVRTFSGVIAVRPLAGAP